MARIYPTTVVALLIIVVVVYLLVFYLPLPANQPDDRKPKDLLAAKQDGPLLIAPGQHKRNTSKGSKLGPGRAPQLQRPSFKGKDIVNVVVCSDEKTLGGLIATVNSIWLNSKSHVKFYIMVDKESLLHLRSWLAIPALQDIDYTMVAFNESWVKGKTQAKDVRRDSVSPMTFARFYFAKVFPTLRGRVVFVDSDTIVQGDIADLNNTKMEPGVAVALSDDCSSSSSRASLHQNVYSNYLNFKSERIKKLGLNPMACSFNAGVFVANISLWKEQKIMEKLDYWLGVNAREDIWTTQRGGGNAAPPMMIVLYKQHTEIPPEWHVRHLGVTSGTRYSENFVKSAKLLHWNGHFKPWGRTSQHTLVWEKYFLPDPMGKFKLIRKYKVD
ncbi:glycosyltransferase 8 domain-containing protein 1-like [Acanthaster planci]|uniref:Glycosyltransferase 8 domain-containing protein 1-like n=1 Tax=Acanthaster planci TaxID=133434 RepID=A0A8B7Z0L4_ACAPL|nr:glycosyltransferase 8 domain-containing protein 1-like [Acanthaster planci]